MTNTLPSLERNERRIDRLRARQPRAGLGQCSATGRPKPQTPIGDHALVPARHRIHASAKSAHIGEIGGKAIALERRGLDAQIGADGLSWRRYRRDRPGASARSVGQFLIDQHTIANQRRSRLPGFGRTILGRRAQRNMRIDFHRIDAADQRTPVIDAAEIVFVQVPAPPRIKAAKVMATKAWVVPLGTRAERRCA